MSSSSSDAALIIMSKITMLATTGLTKKLLVMVMMVVATSSSSPTPTHRLQIDHGIATTLRPAFSSFLCGRLPSPPSPPPAPPTPVRHKDALSHNFLFNFRTNFISLVFFTSSILLTGARVGRRGGKMHVFIVFRTWLPS